MGTTNTGRKILLKSKSLHRKITHLVVVFVAGLLLVTDPPGVNQFYETMYGQEVVTHFI